MHENYVEAQRKWLTLYPITKGDIVTVASFSLSSHFSRDDVPLICAATSLIGEDLKVAAVSPTGVIVHGLFAPYASYTLPFYFLKPKSPILCPYPTGGAVICRNAENDPWQEDVFGHFRVGADYPYICAHQSWRVCFPLSGNEHLLRPAVHNNEAASKTKSALFTPFQQVLVRDNKNSPWQPHILASVDTNSGSRHPYKTISGEYKYCIPYAGNECLISANYYDTEVVQC